MYCPPLALLVSGPRPAVSKPMKGTVEEPGDMVVYQLVMPEEADAEKGMISTSSPIGRAILNKEEGDEIKVTTPNGASRTFELVKVITIHDESA